MGNFNLEWSMTAANDVTVSKYKSSTTQLTVVIAETKGPIVNCDFVLATELENDLGVPHCLEHFTFLGSEHYDYKGLLGLLTNRSIASHATGYTYRDYTDYTLSTVGSSGLLIMLPVYMRHILFPKFDGSDLKTEVYDVTESGTESGIIYAEIKPKENYGPVMASNKLLKNLYPDGCRYQYNPDGLSEHLKDITIEQISKYHQRFYRSENLQLIITGKIKVDDVLMSLNVIDDEIVEKRKKDKPKFFRAPRNKRCGELDKSSEPIRVTFPDNDNQLGLVLVGWRGPSVVTDYYNYYGIRVLLNYLADTSISPLYKTFVGERSLASDIHIYSYEYSESSFALQFDNVPVAQLETIKSELDKVLQNILENDIDMKRIKTVIRKMQVDCLSSIDSSPHSIAYNIIQDKLYGKSRVESLKWRLNEPDLLKMFLSESLVHWRDLFKTYFVGAHSVTVIGTPVQKEDKNNEIDEQSSLKEEQSNDALDDKTIRSRDMSQLPKPTLESINYHSINRYATDSDKQHPKFDAKMAPVYMQVDDIDTEFIYISVLMDSSSLDNKQRLYLPLFLELMLQSPITRNGDEISYEEFVKELQQNTVKVTTQIGVGDEVTRFFCNEYSDIIVLKMQLQLNNYAKGIKLLHELLYQIVITPERIKNLAEKMLKIASHMKRNEEYMYIQLMTGIWYRENTNNYASSILRQEKFLTELLRDMPTQENNIVNTIKTLLKRITDPNNIAIHFACNLTKLAEKFEKLSSFWKDLLPENKTSNKTKLIAVPDHQLMRSDGDSIYLSRVAGMEIATSYYYQSVPGIKDYLDKDLATLQVLLQYFGQYEGPLYKTLRKKGLVYGVTLKSFTTYGKIILVFEKANNVSQFLEVVLKILKDSLNDDYEWDETFFESAKYSLIYEKISMEATVVDVINQSQIAMFRESFMKSQSKKNFERVGYEYNKDFINEIVNVKMEDLKAIAKKYIPALVNLRKSTVAIVTQQTKVQKIANEFKNSNELYKTLATFETIDKSFLNVESQDSYLAYFMRFFASLFNMIW